MRRTAPLVAALVLASAAFVPGAPVPTRPAITAANATRVGKLRELSRDVWDIVWGPERGQVSFVSWEQPVDVLDAGTLATVRRIAPDRKVIHLAFGPGGRPVALCENTTKVEVYPAGGGKPVVLETDNAQPGMAFSPDGKLLATGGCGINARLWDVATGRLVCPLYSGVLGGLTPVFSPDGKTLAIGNRNSTTRLFEASTGKLLHVLPREMSQGLRFSPDGNVLAVTYVDGSLGLWVVADGSLLRSREGVAAELYSVDWSPAGDVLATSGREGNVTLWDPRSLSVLKELDCGEWVVRVRFSPDGTCLLTTGGTPQKSPARKVTVWGVDR